MHAHPNRVLLYSNNAGQRSTETFPAGLPDGEISIENPRETQELIGAR